MEKRAPARLFTIHRTVVYVDPASGQLRHGAVGNSPLNAGFDSEDGAVGGIVFDAGDLRQPIVCGLDGCWRLETAPADGAAGTVLHVVTQDWGWAGLSAEGKYLCAEPDGRITLSRPWCDAWERFEIAELPRSREVFDALGLLTPYDIPEFSRTRVGRCRDGGYVLLDDLDGIEAVYSLGIGDEITFDLELAEMGKKIFMFDHTVDGPPAAHPNFNFFRHEMGTSNDAGAGRFTLQHELERLGCSGRSDLLLKIDIEGAEYDIFSEASRDTLLHFRQMTMEVHGLLGLGDPAFRAKFVSAFSRINSAFTLFHVHANNNGGLGFVDGFVVPDVLELSYVRSDIAARAPSATLYPTVHDYPNWPRRPDYLLWFYPFLPATGGPAIDRNALSASMALSNRALRAWPEVESERDKPDGR
jgi:hypothetical protein